MSHRLRRRYGRASGSLQDRIAGALGWPLGDVQSMSLQSVRELVRPVDPALAAEISGVVQSSSHITRRDRRGHSAAYCNGVMRNGPDKRFVRCSKCGAIDYEKNEGDRCMRLIVSAR